MKDYNRYNTRPIPQKLWGLEASKMTPAGPNESQKHVEQCSQLRREGRQPRQAGEALARLDTQQKEGRRP